MDLLEALGSDAARAESGLTTSRLAELTGRDRGLVTRVVGDLVELGFVERQVGTRRLRLGWRLYVAAQQVADKRLARLGQPVLERLAERTSESAYVCVLHGAESVTLAEASPQQALQVVSWVGRSYPVARSDAGPALMLDLTLAEFAALLGRGPLPESRAARAPETLDGLWTLVDEARRRGISLLDEQADEHVASVAAPVRGMRGRVVAAVVVTGPAVRVRNRFDALADDVLAAARELSHSVGG